jgi:hypothetical protein
MSLTLTVRPCILMLVHLHHWFVVSFDRKSLVQRVISLVTSLAWVRLSPQVVVN